jgi:hypothetical protein
VDHTLLSLYVLRQHTDEVDTFIECAFSVPFYLMFGIIFMDSRVLCVALCHSGNAVDVTSLFTSIVINSTASVTALHLVGMIARSWSFYIRSFTSRTHADVIRALRGGGPELAKLTLVTIMSDLNEVSYDMDHHVSFRLK